MWALKSAVMCETGADVSVSHFVSMICSTSWAFLHSSSAGAKLFPTFMKRAATLLLRRKPAARRFNPCRTHASTAAAWTQTRGYLHIADMLISSLHIQSGHQIRVCVSDHMRNSSLIFTLLLSPFWSQPASIKLQHIKSVYNQQKEAKTLCKACWALFV